MRFSIKDFFSKCDQTRSVLRIWSHLQKKSLMENFIFVHLTAAWLLHNHWVTVEKTTSFTYCLITVNYADFDSKVTGSLVWRFDWVFEFKS